MVQIVNKKPNAVTIGRTMYVPGLPTEIEDRLLDHPRVKALFAEGQFEKVAASAKAEDAKEAPSPTAQTTVTSKTTS